MSDKVNSTIEHDEKPNAVNTEAVMGTSEKTAQFEAAQHEQTFLQAVTGAPKAIGWCMYMFFICIMWGYDGLAGSAVISMPAFRKTYGYLFEGSYVISASWQLGFTAALLVGLIIGGLAAGFLVNRFGRKLVVGGAYTLSIAGVFLQFFGNVPGMFFGGKLLTGIPLGIFTSIAPSYASEVAPFRLRGAIVAGTNFAICLGQLIGYGVMRQSQQIDGPRSYQILFAVQWGFIAVGLVILPFLPESPYYLISKGRVDEARKSIIRLYASDYDVEGQIAEIQESLDQQKQNNEQQGSIIDCFKKENLKRTLCCIMIFFIQNAAGPSWVVGYMTYFMELGGLAVNKAFDVSVGIAGLMVVGNMGGWIWVEWLGRRGAALYGTVFLAVTLILIGVFACVNANWAIWTQVVFMGIWAFIYQGTLGSASWPIVAENSTSSLRNATQGLATAMNGLSSCIWSFALPYAVNPDQGNLGGKIAFIFGAVLVVSVPWIFFMVPETKGRTYVEIDELWATTPPRHWKKKTIVNIPDTKSVE